MSDFKQTIFPIEKIEPGTEIIHDGRLWKMLSRWHMPGNQKNGHALCAPKSGGEFQTQLAQEIDYGTDIEINATS